MASGRNNARRRRVILDEAVQAKAVPLSIANDDPDARSKTKKVYSSAAKRRGQLKTTDLIPKRRWPFVIVIGSTILAYVLINLLAVSMTEWSALSSEAAQAFRISGIGTVSNWFSSLLLMVTGMASLQIYGMRKHRCDDYSGHYKIWLFLAVIFIVASINCVVDFRAIINSISSAAGFSGEHGVVVLLVVKLVALTGLVVRGVLEIRASQGALAAVVLVWIAYASAIFAQIPAVRNELVQNEEFVIGNLFLIGTIATFVTVLIYSRFVYLHANGLIKVEPRQAKASKRASKKVVSDAAEPATKQTKKAAAKRTGQTDAASKPVATPQAAAEEETDAAEVASDEPGEDKKILNMQLRQRVEKAAKKRLAKQAAQHRKAA